LQLTQDRVGMTVSTRAVDTFGLGFLGSVAGSERSQLAMEVRAEVGR
jgi:hypothetical protein